MKKILFIPVLALLSINSFPQLVMTAGTDLYIQSQSHFFIETGMISDSASLINYGTIDLKGNLENNEAYLFTADSDGTLSFSGDSAQKIEGNHDVGFYGITKIDNDSGLSITNTNQSINGKLTITKGKLSLNQFDLFISNLDPSGFSSSKYIVTNATGQLKRQVNADDSSVYFPVGNSSYNPVKLRNTTSANADVYGVRVEDQKPSDTATHFVDRSWIITEETTGGSDLTITPFWNEEEELASFKRDSCAAGLLVLESKPLYLWADFDSATQDGQLSREGSNFYGVGTFAVGDHKNAETDPFILISPEFQQIGAEGGDTDPFYVIHFNIESWQIVNNDTAWVTLNSSRETDSITFNIKENDSPLVREATIIIQDALNPEVADILTIIQDAYPEPSLIAEPSEVFISYNSIDNLIFKITSINVQEWTFENLNTEMIGINTVSQDLLDLMIFENDASSARVGQVRIYSQDDPSVEDIITITQNSKDGQYLILDQYNKSVSASGDTFDILVRSNIENFTVKCDSSWCLPTKGNTIGSDSIPITVEVDANFNILSRQAEIHFVADDSIIETFTVFQKSTLGRTPVSGFVKDRDTIGIDSIKIDNSDTTVVTDENGEFKFLVDDGWLGNITPRIEQYYFSPKTFVISDPIYGPIDPIQFIAFLIDPQINFSVDTTFLCKGDILSAGEENYPGLTVTGTPPEYSIQWEVKSGDAGSISDNAILNPDFWPDETTVYGVKIYYNEYSDSAEFTIDVKELPTALGFEGPPEVCKNQAGVIYSANQSKKPGEHYTWSLSTADPGGTFNNVQDSDIAVINWGGQAGNFDLALKTHNEYCPSPDKFIKTITVTDQEAPEKTTIVWKNPDNVLCATDPLIDSCEWGWYEMDGNKIKGEPVIIDGENEFCCRLPVGHEFKPQEFHYFVNTWYDSLDCWSRTFYETGPLEINEKETNDIIVYPNPTSGLINISFKHVSNSGSSHIELYDITGNLIYKKELELTKNNMVITIPNGWCRENGIYILHVRSEDSFLTSKIVVR